MKLVYIGKAFQAVGIMSTTTIVEQNVDAPVVGELTDVEPPLCEILESLTKVMTFSQKSGLSRKF